MSRYELTQELVLEELHRVYEEIEELYDILLEISDEIWEELGEDADEIIEEYLSEYNDRVKSSQRNAARMAIDIAESKQDDRITTYFALCGTMLSQSLVKTYQRASRDAYKIMDKVPAWRNPKLDVVERYTAKVRITDTYITSNVLPIPWCKDGKTYSARLYSHVANFEKKLRFVLDEGINKGKGMAWMQQAWRKLVHATAYDTARLLKTETMAMYNRALKDSYLEMGVEYVEIVGDAECGGICLDYVDGDPIRLDEAEINDELPPYHPNCACSFMVYEEENLEE